MANVMDYRSLSLEEQVAQLFVVGYEGLEPNAVTHQFLKRGVGGLIFFRDNFQNLQPASARTAKTLLEGLSASIPAHCPRPFLSIDQEGGQVERLPHTLFPTALTPRAVALSTKPYTLARDMYGMMAGHLAWLGFNMDFFPTLDVNLNRHNPIIGVRSFGDNPQTVWHLAQIAHWEFENAGVITVGKHFPGHGNGTVDSHLDLPTLHFTEEELWPFRQMIEAGIPAMLVAHGFYPALQTTSDERNLPSSASPAVIQGLLREHCGFDGLIITDDMCMGAITKHRNPVEAALASLRAGVDILLYKQSTKDEWQVYQAVVEAFRSGSLPMDRLHQSLERIFKLKCRLTGHNSPNLTERDFRPEVCRQKADALARQGISILSGKPEELLPLNPNAPLLLLHPDRDEMGNYAFDVPTSDNLADVFREAGFKNLDSIAYPLKSQASAAELLDRIKADPAGICMVSFNPQLNPLQAALYRLLKARYPRTPILLASAGTPYDAEVLSSPDLHLALCSYRPASMHALSRFLLEGTGVG